MKLFLASQAKHPKSLEKLKTFIGGFEGKSIAYIPTATNGQNHYGEWVMSGGSWQVVNTLGANVTAVVLEEYKSEKVVEVLRNKDIIWFAGGMAGYLMYWIIRCQLDKYLPKLLKSGSVYVGSSVGSMITAPILNTAEWYLRAPENGASLLPSLGFIDFEIYPHFEDDLLPEIKSHWRGGKLCLLKDGEAITVVDGKVEILGKERFLEEKNNR